MKTTSLILFLLVCLSGLAQGRKDATVKDDVYSDPDLPKYTGWTQGYVVMQKNGDTIRGLLNTPLSSKFWLYDPAAIRMHRAGVKDKRYKADDVAFYEYQDSSGLWIRYIPYQPMGDGSKVFVRRYIDGRCKAYYLPKLNTVATALGGTVGALLAGPDTLFLIQKGTSSLWPVPRAGFRKDMMEFFQKCPEMVAMIKAETFTYETFERMVHYYNEHGCR